MKTVHEHGERNVYQYAECGGYRERERERILEHEALRL
jgi:hypothetical protein